MLVILSIRVFFFPFNDDAKDAAADGGGRCGWWSAVVEGVGRWSAVVEGVGLNNVDDEGDGDEDDDEGD